MAHERRPLETSTPPPRTGVNRGSPSFVAVEERLASAERELAVQFTRIAQLQAQLDLVLAALRPSPGGVRTDDRIRRTARTVSARSSSHPVSVDS